MYIGIMCILISHCFANKLILEQSFSNDLSHIATCLDHIININGKSNIYTVDLDFPLKNPVIRINLSKQHTHYFRFERSDACIINLKGRDLDQFLIGLFKQQSINPRGLFLVITEEVNESIFISAIGYYIANLIVVEEVTQSLQKIYTYDPYVYEDVDHPRIEFFQVATCSDGVLTKESFNFTHVQPKKWRNTTIKIINNNVQPYAHLVEGTSNIGLEIELFNAIAQALEVTPFYMSSSHFTLWGDKHNGTYDLLLGKLEKRMGDMVIGCFHFKGEQFLDFDMTYPHMEETVYWLVPKAKLLPTWKNFSFVFRKEVFLAVVLSIGMFMVVLRIGHGVEFCTSFILLYRVLLELSSSNISKYRIIIVMWIAPALVLSTMFKSKLTAVMSKEMFEPQIDSLRDMVASSIQIRINGYIAEFYMNSTNPDEQYIVENYEFNNERDYLIYRIAHMRDTISIDFERSFDYRLPQFLDSDGYPLLHLIRKSPIFITRICLFFTKGYPVVPQVNQMLMRAKDSGLVQRLYNQLSHKSKLALSTKQRSTFSARALGLDNMCVSFLLWGIGVLLSLIAFLAEYFIKTNKSA